VVQSPGIQSASESPPENRGRWAPVNHTMDGFVKMVTSLTEFTIFGDDQTALVWFDTHLQKWCPP
jgi:hypothetical protein